MYKFNDISKTYGSSKILNEIEISIEDSSIEFLTGRSGTGKTTLLKILSGIETYSNKLGASVFINEPSVSYVPQAGSLWNNLTVRDNIVLYRKLFLGESGSEALKKCEWLLETLKIADKLNRFPAKLSAGEHQRVAVARALASDKKLILLDETTANLDFDNKEILQTVIQKSVSLGKSFLFVSHDLHFISLFSKTCLVLENGKIQKKEISIYGQNSKITGF